MTFFGVLLVLEVKAGSKSGVLYVVWTQASCCVSSCNDKTTDETTVNARTDQLDRNPFKCLGLGFDTC